jgi:hypothetical protein
VVLSSTYEILQFVKNESAVGRNALRRMSSSFARRNDPIGADTAPIWGIHARCHIAVKRGMLPIHDCLHVSVLDGIEMHVIHIRCIVMLIAQRVGWVKPTEYARKRMRWVSPTLRLLGTKPDAADWPCTRASKDSGL